MDIEIDNENYQGNGAPLTAPKTDEQQDLSLEEQGFQVMDEEQSADEANTADEQGSEEKPEGEGTSGEAKNLDGETKEENTKVKFSGAARKRFRYFVSLGMSTEDAKERALAPIGPSHFPKGSKPEIKDSAKNAEKGIKVCIVLDNFPEESLTPEQAKTIQEAIMDKILDMGNASTTKPKFTDSTFQKAWLAVMCADKTTVDWLKEVTPTLKPWEEASLKALEDEEMPHPWTFVGFLPDSKDYSDEKILKLLEAQNDSFNVSTWKIVKREAVDSELEITFSIDRKFTSELKQAEYKVSYKFGHVQLWPKGKKPPPKGAQSSSGKQKQKFKGPPRRSNWRHDTKSFNRGGSSWRDDRRSRGGVSKPYQESYSRSGRSPRLSPWEGPSTRKNQGGMAWRAESWKPWE